MRQHLFFLSALVIIAGTNLLAQDNSGKLGPLYTEIYPCITFLYSSGISGNWGNKVVPELNDPKWNNTIPSAETEAFSYSSRMTMQVRISTYNRLSVLLGAEYEQIHYTGHVDQSTNIVVVNGRDFQFLPGPQWDYSYSEYLWHFPISFTWRLSRPDREYKGLRLAESASFLVKEHNSDYNPSYFHSQAGVFTSLGFVFVKSSNSHLAITFEPSFNFQDNTTYDSRRFWSAEIKVGLGLH